MKVLNRRFFMKKTAMVFLIWQLFLSPCLIFASDDPKVDIHGFIGQGYLKSDHNNFLADTQDGTFQYNEMGLDFITRMNDRLRVGMQFFARDLGSLGNDEIKLDWAYADYCFSNKIGLRAGIMKITHGFYNESRDSDMARTSIFLPQGMYNEEWRDSFIAIKGLSAYGYLFNHMAYQFQAGKLDAPLDGGLAKMFNGLGIFTIDSINTEKRLCYNGSIQIQEIIDGLKVGASFIDWEFTIDMTYKPTYNINLPIPVGTKGLVNGKATIWSTGVEYNYNAINLASEYVILSWDIPASILSFKNIGDLIPGYSFLNFDMEGWYVSGSYRFSDWFELGLMYSEYYWDKNDKNGSAYAKGVAASKIFNLVPALPSYWRYQKDLTLSTRFDINENWTAKLEIHRVNGVGICDIGDNPGNGEWYDLEKDWMLFAAKVIFSF